MQSTKTIIWIFLLFLFTIWAKPLWSQTPLNLKTDTVLLTDTLAFDGSVWPKKFHLKTSDSIVYTDFSWNYIKGELYVLNKTLIGQELVVQYLILPKELAQTYSKMDVDLITYGGEKTRNPFIIGENNNQYAFNSSNLQRQGSISRGFSFGNNQNLSVNSNLNLQLSGALNNEINIKAVITDDNIPIQADGNTQQIQEFDQVYIQLWKDDFSVIAGDFRVENKTNQYNKYFKKAKGLSFSSTLKSKKGNQINTTLSGAASGGKFSRNQFNGEEGNQGPYRLKGAENESYIVVLSGSERVYIDGNLLTRGQENQYTIDYNTAEITFTSNQIITKDSRINIEFQYSSRNYARSLINTNVGWKAEKSSFFLDVYAEQDHKNQAILSDFNDPQKALLAEIGDNIDSAFFTGVKAAEYDENIVMYEKIDSLGYSPVYRVSSNPLLAIYRVTFSEVGIGKGNYVPSSTGVNGRAFTWVAPDTSGGIIQYKGNYEPIVLLNTPKAQQIISSGWQYQLGKNQNISTEISVSNRDINTFSSIDQGDNIGYAANIHYNALLVLKKDSLHAISLSPGITYERIDKLFRPVERIRNVEFNRDWNLQSNPLSQSQNMLEGKLTLNQKGVGVLSEVYNRSFNSENKEFSGNNFGWNMDFTKKKWTVWAKSSLMQSNNRGEKTQFIRNESKIRHRFSFIELGLSDIYEKNHYFLNQKDSLIGPSYSFLQWDLGLYSPLENKKWNYALSYGTREDHLLDKGALYSSAIAENYLAMLSYSSEQDFRLKLSTKYRNLRIIRQDLIGQNPDQTFLGRLEADFGLFKGLLQSNNYYELGSGLERRRAYSYLQVAPGQGTYDWIDYDSSGTKELNEFELAVFNDQKNYIKIYTPTNEFIKAFSYQYSQSLSINPKKIIKTKSGILSMVKRFYNQTSLRSNWKSLENHFPFDYNPYNQNFQDTILVGMDQSLRNSLYFNRSSPKFGVNYNVVRLLGKNLLNSGFESRYKNSHEVNLRFAPVRVILMEIIAAKTAKKSQYSEPVFAERNYNLVIQKAEPKISYQKGSNWRISLSYRFTEKKNEALLGGQLYENKAIIWDLRWQTAKQSNLTVSATYQNIRYTDPKGDFNSNSAISFEMLEGLNPGDNYTWEGTFQRKINSNIQMSLNYSGRFSEKTDKVIHLAGMEVRAFF